MKSWLLLFGLSAWSGFAPAGQIERESPSCDKDAISKVRTAAARNEPRALYLLARYYSTGKCVAGDGLRALGLYAKAAEQKYPRAFYNLGIIHARDGDYRSAESFFLRGTELGPRGCELQLGILYSIAPPPVGDHVKGAAWLSLSAGRPEPIAEEAQDILEGQLKRMDPAVRDPASQMAADLKARYGPIPEFTE